MLSRLSCEKTKSLKSLWKCKTWSNWSVSLKNWSRKSYFNTWGADLKCARHSIIDRMSFYLLSEINTLNTMLKLMNDDVTESRWRHGVSVSFCFSGKDRWDIRKTLSSIERICHSTSILKKVSYLTESREIFGLEALLRPLLSTAALLTEKPLNEMSTSDFLLRVEAVGYLIENHLYAIFDCLT